MSWARGSAASRWATASDMRWNWPPAFASSNRNRGAEYRSGIVTWAATSATVQLAHSDGATHWSALSPSSNAASSRRPEAIQSVITAPI
jgi:hypothetical protein